MTSDMCLAAPSAVTSTSSQRDWRSSSCLAYQESGPYGPGVSRRGRGHSRTCSCVSFAAGAGQHQQDARLQKDLNLLMTGMKGLPKCADCHAIAGRVPLSPYLLRTLDLCRIGLMIECYLQGPGAPGLASR